MISANEDGCDGSDLLTRVVLVEVHHVLVLFRHGHVFEVALVAAGLKVPAAEEQVDLYVYSNFFLISVLLFGGKL